MSSESLRAPSIGNVRGQPTEEGLPKSVEAIVTEEAVMGEQPFAGNAKTGKPLFDRWEQALIARYVSRIPPWLETYHLTLLSLVWSGLVLWFSWWARKDIRWLWGSSAAIVGQYLTDIFDGAVGRHRNTGLVRWGYYMDHLLDFIFLCAIGVGYAWLMPASLRMHLVAITMAFAGAMASTYLAFNVTSEFRMSHFRIGPTELRIVLLMINTLLICFKGFRQGLETAVPVALVVSLVALGIVIDRTQRRIWNLDMNK